MTLPIQYPDSSQVRHQDSTVAAALASVGVPLGNIAALRAHTIYGGTIIQPDRLPAAGRWKRDYTGLAQHTGTEQVGLIHVSG